MELHRRNGLAFYRAMFAQAGYEADIARPTTWRPMVQPSASRISNAFIEDLCAIGKPRTWRRPWPATAGANNLRDYQHHRH